MSSTRKWVENPFQASAAAVTAPFNFLRRKPLTNLFGSNASVNSDQSVGAQLLLFVSLVQGRNLPAYGGYVVVTVDGHKRQSRRVADCNPVWNERFDFAIAELPETLDLFLLDKNHECIGKYVVSTSNDDGDAKAVRWHTPVKAQRNAPEIQIQLGWGESELKLEMDEELDYVNMRGLLTVRVGRAQNIKPTVRHWKRMATLGFKGNILQPRIVLEYGLTAYRTKPQSGPNPNFNQECRFWVLEGEENYVMRVSVYNDTGPGRSALVGRAYIDLRSVVGEESGEFDFIVDVREEGYNRMTDADHTTMMRGQNSSVEDVPSLSSINSLNSLNNRQVPPPASTGRSSPVMTLASSRSFESLLINPASAEASEQGHEFAIDMIPPENEEGLLSDDATHDESMMNLLIEGVTEIPVGAGSEPTSPTKKEGYRRLFKLPKPRERGVQLPQKPLRQESQTCDEMGFTTPDPDYSRSFVDLNVRHHSKHEGAGALVGVLAVRIKFTPKRIVESYFFRRVLDEFDDDGDGRLNHDESLSVLEAMCVAADYNEEQLESLFKRLDRNGDGVLQEEELVQFLVSPEFLSQPMSLTLLSFMVDGATGLASYINDTYTVAQSSTKTTKAGAGTMSVRDGDRIELDMRGLKVMDRKTGLIVEEHIPKYIKIGLRLLYSSRVLSSRKRVIRFLKKMSFKEGARMETRESVAQIRPFIKTHQLDPSEWLLPLDDNNQNYPCFNAFFYRKLKPDARPIDYPDDDGVAVSPADCRMVVYGNVLEATKVWVKGSEFTIERLLTDKLRDIAPRFTGGSMVIARLAPQDYHRWHFPVSGRLGRVTDVDGALYTVNPIAIRQTVNVFTDNIRKIQEIHSEEFGLVLAVCIGATLVGSVNLTAFEKDREIRKGDEHGYFAFGGSTVIVLFQPGAIKFDRDLVDNSRIPMETLVRMGTRIGVSANRARSQMGSPVPSYAGELAGLSPNVRSPLSQRRGSAEFLQGLQVAMGSPRPLRKRMTDNTNSK